jgi:hypothetical protein
MNFFHIFGIVFTLFMTTAHAEIEKNADGDILLNVSSKLSQIQDHLKDNRVFISTAAVQWPELEVFKSELMYVVAHDPHGSLDKNSPPELSPLFMTQRLKSAWVILNESVLTIGDLSHSPDWLIFKQEMEKFFKLRDDYFYQSARGMIKSGLITMQIQKIKEQAIFILKDATEKNLSVKIIDPVIVNMANELSVLNKLVSQLEELRKPRPVENLSLYQQKFYPQLWTFGIMVIVSGILLTLAFVWLQRKLVKVPSETKKLVPSDTFNYYEWLKKLEANLQSFKNQEEKVSEQYINLKEHSLELSQARKGLNQADNQQDYYESLNQLNSSAPKIEDYFEKVNLKSHTDSSRRLISQMVQLCDAIENKKEMSFDAEKPQLRVIKLGQASHLKSA